MSIDSNLKKSQLLGMPYGTACNRLKKNILFNVLKRHRENFCFRCDKEILVVDDLTIEHKKDWLNKDVNLFWDLENTAFSHKSCNVAYCEREIRTGFLFCIQCKKWKTENSFRQKSLTNKTAIKKRNRRSYLCLDCERKVFREYWHRKGKLLREKRKILVDSEMASQLPVKE